MVPTEFHDVNWDKETTQKFLDLSDSWAKTSKEFSVHEVQCEERWKTCFYRLEELDKSMRRIESRMMMMGGTVILFLAGLVVTLTTMGVH